MRPRGNDSRLRGHRPLAGVVVTAVVLAGTAGCTSPSGPSAEDAATELARALTSGTLTGLDVAGGTPDQAQRLWTDATQGLGDSSPHVSVVDVADGEDGPSTARLAYTWRLAGVPQEWRYRTTARLTRAADDTWQVRLAPSLVHPDLRAGERLRLSTVAAPRGDITGAGGTPLVTERPVVRLGIDKTTIAPPRQVPAARALARLVDVDPAAYVDQVRAAGDKAFVEAIVLRPEDARPVLQRGAGSLPGVSVLRDTLPLAPTREFARPVLGSVGPVTAEMVKASKGAYRAGDEAGLSGLEARYDEQLRGTPGVTVTAEPAADTPDAPDTDTTGGAGGAGRELYTVDPQPGQPLATTLDLDVQSAAEAALADVSSASAVVAVRPSTGDVLAAASGPGSGGLSVATVGRYAPGSTFKVVTSLALLRAGVTPSTPLDCPRTTVVDGKTFKNYDDYPAGAIGRIPLSAAVASSCNTAFIGERETVGQADLADAAAALGLGVDRDLGLPAFLGEVPADEAAAGGTTGHAASMIGQGKVLASPLAMATVAASVAKGALVVPRVLPDQTPEATTPGSPLTAGEAASLRRLMRGVVTGGSGAFLSDVPGPPVLAKTGTAEFGETEPLQTHAWMIGVQGDLAVAVFVEIGDSGSGTAGPVLEAFLRAVG